VFQAEALEVLGSKDAPAACRRAAAFYLSRHADPPPMTALGSLASVLEDRDPDTAAFGARAWARIVGAGAMEAAVLALAFEEGGPRMVQIARLRALASLPPGPSRTVFTAALGDDDPHIRLTALESVAACGGRLASDDRAGLATFAVLMEETDPVMSVRRAAVLALARIAPEIFLPRLPRYRLGAPPMVRIAAAEAIGGMPWQGVVLTASQRFLCDPDRRVAQTLLEAAERRVKEGEAAEVDRIVSGLLRLDGEGEAPVAAGRGDPVLLGLLAKVGTALLARPDLTPPSKPRDLLPLLERLVGSTPPTEVESLQAIIDLAAALPPSTGTPVLGDLARTAEPALHDQAARHLRARGEAVPAPLPLARPWTPSPDPATRAIVHTTRGEIALDLRPDVAPATVANFVQLARQGFYDGVLFHRVVPGFVAQAGCPRGDGWGGPGYTIRCENSALTYQRGTLGMALAGKDTGGSQWFLSHEAQPHLDQRYPIFGQVATGLDVLDALLPGDVILTVTIP
jgi:cyclophilin family peptidyl-prolyl cis-trans isomerase